MPSIILAATAVVADEVLALNTACKKNQNIIEPKTLAIPVSECIF